MTEKDKYVREMEELERKIFQDAIKEVFAGDPANYRKGMEELGFTWFDDEGDPEEEEEATARPENERQEKLVAWFEGGGEVSNAVLEALQEERYSEKPNLPLIRKYFRAGNPRLEELILFGLENEPTRADLLSDLAYFHEFTPILPELVACYTRACRLEDDPEKFLELAWDFYFATLEDDYDVLQELGNLFAEDTDKARAVAFLATELLPDGGPEADLEF